MNGIKRKIGAAAASVPEGHGALAQWGLALARGARDAGGLDLAAGGVQAGRASLAELLEVVPERGLIAVLAGPRGATGVIVLSADVLAALVERQTLGRVIARPAVPRRTTRTDAALASALIDGAMASLDISLMEEDDRIWASGYRYASYLEDARPLALLLEDCTYRMMRVEVDLGEGAKSGEVMLALPAEGRADPPLRHAAAAEASAALVFQAALCEQVMGATAQLEAVIARVTLPLSQVMALAAGEVLCLGSAALDRIDLEGPDGLSLGSGRLGQTRGLRALRLSQEAIPAARGQGGLTPGLAMLEEQMRRTGTG